jgi:hypothetical protein
MKTQLSPKQQAILLIREKGDVKGARKILREEKAALNYLIDNLRVVNSKMQKPLDEGGKARLQQYYAERREYTRMLSLLKMRSKWMR